MQHYIAIDETYWSASYQACSGLRTSHDDAGMHIVGGAWGPKKECDWSVLTTPENLPQDQRSFPSTMWLEEPTVLCQASGTTCASCLAAKGPVLGQRTHALTEENNDIPPLGFACDGGTATNMSGLMWLAGCRAHALPWHGESPNVRRLLQQLHAIEGFLQSKIPLQIGDQTYEPTHGKKKEKTKTPEKDKKKTKEDQPPWREERSLSPRTPRPSSSERRRAGERSISPRSQGPPNRTNAASSSSGGKGRPRQAKGQQRPKGGKGEWRPRVDVRDLPHCTIPPSQLRF